MEPITNKELEELNFFKEVPIQFMDAIKEAYKSADEILCKILQERSHLYWIVLQTIKYLYLKSIVFFDLELLIKFIFIKKNRVLFEAYYIDNRKDLIKTARLVGRKFAEAYGMKPYEGTGAKILSNERADQNFFEYNIINHSSELGLTIEEFLNEYGRQGWNLTAIKNNSYIFKRTIVDDYLFF